MGLIKAGIGALGGTLADQWKEFFYCDALDSDVLVKKGQKRTSGRSSNTKGEDNIISNGSGIAVADGQCMIIVEQGKIVEVCAEPGEFTYDTSTEPSVFSGKLGDSIKESFKTLGKRFTYGGDTGKDQRIYYFNTKEIIGNKFGTPTPIMFDVVNREIGMSRTVQVRCNGMYSYTISNPLIFYTRVCGNVEYEYTRDEIDAQLKTEFVSALQPALGALSELGLRPAQLPAKVTELKSAMNDALKAEWVESRGITVEKIALNPITLTDEDMKKINEMEDAATYGSNAFMMAGRMTQATANAMETAAANEAGAMNGFIGMGMATPGGAAGGFSAAQQFYNAGVEQAAKAPKDEADAWKCSCGQTATGKFCPECGAKRPEAGWSCSCGTINKGKFCTECGAKKPAGEPLYRCDKCGFEPEDPKNPPKFCPECGDIFNDSDIK
ncbi:MAG: SPFH domain-containing protein [Ruminococcaceae bacterium]|nr:SPFH domain-containing protein [Oscillospiraceae bacterium]